MLRTLAVALLLAVTLLAAPPLFSQCIIAPPPDPCVGNEPLLSDNETLVMGGKKWYYGATAVYNQLTLRGGTLVVCGNLTINNFFMDSGVIVIRSGATLRLGGGAGIIFRGNSAVYNYGTLDFLSVVSLDNTWASASKPNLIINATTSSVLWSTNYFVINNPYSFFVNKGSAEFWGIVTDYNAGVGSVCLGFNSTTKMSVLINNKKDTYAGYDGGSCLHVAQYSSFRDTLTHSNTINVCLGNSHTTDGCGTCRPNAWGTPNRFAFCSTCATITLLTTSITDFALSQQPGGNKLSWKTTGAAVNTVFVLERSVDGTSFSAIDSLKTTAYNTITTFSIKDGNPPSGNVFYRIKYSQPATGQYAYTAIVKAEASGNSTVTVSPNPFVHRLQVAWTGQKMPKAVYLTNAAGILYYSVTIKPADGHKIVIPIPGNAAPGEYFVKLVYSDEVVVKKVLKQQESL